MFLPARNNLFLRCFHISSALRLKQIVAIETNKTTVVVGKTIPSPREPYVISSANKDACPVCRLGLDIKHTDVLILHQFVRSDGCMLPRRVTGLCNKQQRRISSMVAMAQKAGILFPPGSKTDPSKRKEYKRWNTYFDESTIKAG